MKKITLRLLLVLGLLSATTTTSNASHLLGGAITWECMPTGQFRFTLTLYRDCTGVPLSSTTETISITGAGNIACTKIATNYTNLECNAPTCIGATVPYQGAIEEHVYQSAPITLTGTPTASGWTATWTTCCRPNTTNLVNASGQSTTLRARMFPYQAPGSSAPSTTNTCYDSSPQFLENPNFVYCANKNASYSFGGFDLDGDSLYYDLAAPLNTSLISSVSFAAGYSYSQPLPQASNQWVNHDNGTLNFNSNTTGNFATCGKIQAWRHGQLIADVYRDMNITIRTCAPAAGLCGGIANNVPSLAFGWVAGFGTLVPVYDAANHIIRYELIVAPGTPIKFNMFSQDTDLQPSCSPQAITFSGTGVALSAAPTYNSATNCPTGVNCATITPGAGQTGFTSTLSNSVQFNWTPDCGAIHASKKNQAYDFRFSFSDNACPYPEKSDVLVRINVVKPSPQGIVASQAVFCPGATVTLTGPANMDSYLWSTNDTTQSITVTSAGVYSLAAAYGVGCVSNMQYNLSALQIHTSTPEICLVSLDTATGFNTVIWERPNKLGTVGYTINRSLNGGVFSVIDSQDVNELSVFVDSSSNQNNGLYSYYIGIIDSCGGVNGTAAYTHSAPFLMAFMPNATQVQLSWSHYVGRTPNYYIVYRSDFAGAPYTKIDSVLYPAFNFLDTNLPAGTSFSYRLGAVMDSSCLPTAKADWNQSISNVATFAAFGLDETLANGQLPIYPNPSNGIFILDETLCGAYEVLSLTGAVVKSGTICGGELSLVNQANGLYILKITLKKDGAEYFQRLIKQ